MKMLKVLSLFSGIGAFEKALERLNIDYELVGFSEIDKYAIKSYCAIHGVSESLNLGDVSKIDTSTLPKDVDLLTHGSPCQDFSMAGKQAGGDKDSGTRSSLMYETIRIIGDIKPKYIIWENVKNLLSKKHIHNFNNYLKALDDLGYNSYYQVLNAKDYGIPQNRERVFTVSIRKDIDPYNLFQPFPFPEKQELKLRLKDILEDNVDEKYYLSEKMIKYISANNEKWTGNNNEALINKSVASTINTGEGCRSCDASNYISNDLPDNADLKVIRNGLFNTKSCLIQVGQLYGTDKEPNPSGGRVYSPSGIMRTLGVGNGMSQPIIVDEPKIKVVGKTKSGGERSLISGDDGISNCLSATDYKQPKQIKTTLKPKEYVGDSVNQEQPKIIDDTQGFDGVREYEDYSPTLRAARSGLKVEQYFKIRKLTPCECWRLMGFDDEDVDKCSAIGISNSQLYKQASNSIVVNVLVEIFKELFKEGVKG